MKFTFFSHAEEPDDGMDQPKTHSEKDLNALLSVEIELYSPIYETISESICETPVLWNILNSSGIKDFYRTKEDLFREDPHAKGCFKIKLSRQEVTKILFENKALDTYCSFDKTKREWLLAIAPRHIDCYINKSTCQEFINPYQFNEEFNTSTVRL